MEKFSKLSISENSNSSFINTRWSPLADKEFNSSNDDILKKNRRTKFPISLLQKMHRMIVPVKKTRRNLNILVIEDQLIYYLGENVKLWFYKNINGFLEMEMQKYIMPLFPIEMTLVHINVIQNFLNRYEIVYPRVKVLGPFYFDNPDAITKELDTMNLTKYDSFAFFMNTASSRSGSHWVACWIDIKKNCGEFFDSIGNLAPRPEKIIRILCDYFGEIFLDFSKKCYYSPIRFQTSGSDCGIYTCLFLQWKILNPGKSVVEFRDTTKLDPSSVAQRKFDLFNVVNLNMIQDKELKQIYEMSLEEGK